MKKYFCPFCGKELNRNGVHHIYSCSSNTNLTDKDEIRLAYLKYNFGENIMDNVITDYQNLYSLPMLKEKYNIDYKSIIFLLKKNNIEIRNISNSAKLISVEKHKKTCLERYGVDNVSKTDFIKEKKKQTFLEHYGVDNIWKVENYTRDIWNSFSEEKKQEIIKKIYTSINKNKSSGSKIEKKVASILDDIGLSYHRQFFIKGSRHPYDFKLEDSKILIEVNGKYWHADPRYYKKDDIVNQPGDKSLIKASEIWDKDRKIIEYANNHGYRVITLWEDEIRNYNDKELMKHIINLINE